MKNFGNILTKNTIINDIGGYQKPYDLVETILRIVKNGDVRYKKYEFIALINDTFKPSKYIVSNNRATELINCLEGKNLDNILNIHLKDTEMLWISACTIPLDLRTHLLDILIIDFERNRNELINTNSRYSSRLNEIYSRGVNIIKNKGTEPIYISIDILYKLILMSNAEDKTKLIKGFKNYSVEVIDKVDDNKYVCTMDGYKIEINSDTTNKLIENNKVKINTAIDTKPKVINVICIDKHYTRGKITSYLIQDETGHKMVVSREKLLLAMNKGLLKCENLKISSDGMIHDIIEVS